MVAAWGVGVCMSVCSSVVVCAGFRDTVMRMLALDPNERITIDEALMCFEALPLPPQLDASDDEVVLSSAVETGNAAAAPVSLTARYVNGQSTTLVVDPTATVGSVLQRCLSAFFPTRCVWLSLYLELRLTLCACCSVAVAAQMAIVLSAAAA